MNTKPFFTKKYLNFPFFYKDTQLLVQMGIWSSREIVWINDEKFSTVRAGILLIALKLKLRGAKLNLPMAWYQRSGCTIVV